MLIQLKKLKKILINESKVTKYLLYAFGEICLVVIGILVAVQFNNINLSRQYRQIELQYYQTMKDQLAEDRATLKDEIYGATMRKEAYSTGKLIIKTNDRDRKEELGKIVVRLVEYGDFRRNSNVYPTLVYSGEIKYIKNKKIIEDLQEIERIYEITERLEETQANFVMTHMAPAILEMVDFESGEILFPDLVFTKININRIAVASRLVDEKLAEYNNAIKIIDDVTKEINGELGLKNE